MKIVSIEELADLALLDGPDSEARRAWDQIQDRPACVVLGPNGQLEVFAGADLLLLGLPAIH